MRESIKTLLKRLRDIGARRSTSRLHENDEPSAADVDKIQLSPRNCNGDHEADLSFSGDSFEDDPCSYRPNVATCLIILFLLIVFCILPGVYLFHCFGLLNNNWTSSHSRFENHKLLIFSEEDIDFLTRFKSTVEKNLKIVKPNDQTEKLSNPIIISEQQCSNIPNNLKFDCYPEENGANETTCKARGCCWSPSARATKDTSMSVPYCFYPNNYGGYDWVNITESPRGVSAFMSRSFKSPYPDDVQLLRMDVKYETNNRIRIKIYDPLRARFEPPYPEVPIVDGAPPNTNYIFKVDKKNSGFKILRKSDNTPIFDTQNIGGMIFANQFLQISSLLPSKYVYGLGEHRSTFLLSTDWQKFVMWNHDSIPKENTNLYGSHPFYMAMEKSGKTHGVFLLNSNAMEVVLQPGPAVTFRTIGGIFDFYVFLGPTPSEVTQQYLGVVGKPFMPPYWSLGFHLCRFGYKSLNNTRDVWKRTRDFGIPLDVQWNDLDYMNNSNDFTYDKVNFEGLPAFVQELHDLGMKYTVLVDPGVSSSEKIGSYPPFDDGLKLGVFVKNSSGQPFEGKVWNGVSTVWPDFTHPATVDYWMKQLGDMHREFAFDGAWIDMNEPSNFYSGTKHGCPDNNLDRPPYVPAVDGGFLAYKSLCASSVQYAGEHYDTHNLYGFTEAIVTSFAMSEIRSSRPFVISRSTFPGHGHFAGHWTGDVESSWQDMRNSVAQVVNLNVLGIPLTGADICGFNGNTTAELCNRWSQLGAFYPFSRNHNTDDGLDQDPVALGKDVALSAKNALTVRYSLLPYLYTLFYEAHERGTTVARPLLFEFPSDKATYDIDVQFLWGGALMIVPVLDPDQVQVSAYLPDCVWYDFYTMGGIRGGGKRHTLEAPLHRIPLLLRGGYVVPMQEPSVTTVESRKNPFRLMAMADMDGNASGNLFWDDGETLNTVENHRYNLLNFTLHGSELTGGVTWWGYDAPMVLKTVAVLGVKKPVKTVYVNEIPKPFSYDTINKFLLLEDLKLSLKDGFTIRWI